jgi:hypothetical protein
MRLALPGRESGFADQVIVSEKQNQVKRKIRKIGI